MTKTEVNNIEEMSNKIIEYVHTVAKNNEDYEQQCMALAAKMILASFSFDTDGDKGIMLSNEQIIARCMNLCDMIFSAAMH